MSTTDTSLQQLIIHSGTQAQIDSAIEQELIGENDLVFITDGGDPIDALYGASNPTTATVGKVGTFYINTTTGDVYHCTSVDELGPSYTWAKFGEGGGGGGSNIIIASTDPTTSTVGTVGQYYINTTTQQCFQLVRISLGNYTWIRQINENNYATTSASGVVKVDGTTIEINDGVISSHVALTSGTYTLEVSSWNNKTYSLAVSGVTAQSIIWIEPTYSADGSNELAYADANIRGASQGNGVINFTCETIPVTNINVDIILG